MNNEKKIPKTQTQKHKELSLTFDINEEIAVVSYEPDDEVKEKKNITLTTEVIPFYLEKLDAIAQENNGHLALGRVNIPLISILLRDFNPYSFLVNMG